MTLARALPTVPFIKSRLFATSSIFSHENPLGLPRRPGPAPQIPRKGGTIQNKLKRSIPNVQKVLAVASGKGGVGKSTVAVNLAFSLALLRNLSSQGRLRVGILDLDIFGPSIPTLMGLQRSEEPRLTSAGAIVPIVNHGLPVMSMGFLLPRSPDATHNSDTAIVWRGLMVQKAVQQLLFDVDWSDGKGGPGLDVLVIDMPPGTGDVPLTLGQLVNVDGAVIVSTPQDVALADVRRGIAMFRKVSVPITGILLNQSYFFCPTCTSPHYLFGSPDLFRGTARDLRVDILGELPLVQGVSSSGDQGVPYALVGGEKKVAEDGAGGVEWSTSMEQVAEKVWKSLSPT